MQYDVVNGRHVLLDDTFYLKVCIMGYVMRFEMSYWSTCFTGGHILQDDLSYRSTHHI